MSRRFVPHQSFVIQSSPADASILDAIGFHAFTTGTDRYVAELSGEMPSYAGGLTVSPDGKSIVYSRISRSASDIILVDNFRCMSAHGGKAARNQQARRILAP